MLDPVLVEPVDSVDVGKTFEGTSGGSEVGVELLDQCSGDGVFEEAIDGFADLSRRDRQESNRYHTGIERRTISSKCDMRSSNVIKASSASKWVYSLRCLRVWLGVQCHYQERST